MRTIETKIFTLFQFNFVRLKVVCNETGKVYATLFQFNFVRLKDCRGVKCNIRFQISIQLCAIKRNNNVVSNNASIIFQFNFVRLKDSNVRINALKDYNFNSTLCD